MGTRSLTVIVKDGIEVATMYRQYDGYLEGHGLDIAKLLQGMAIVNGIRDDMGKIANGMNCLAAQVVAHFKTKAGNIYLYEPHDDKSYVSYIYTVTGKVGDTEPSIKCNYGYDNELIFEGSASDMIKFIESDNEQ